MPTEAPNPIALLKKISGCQFKDNATNGETDPYTGDRVGECEVGANTYKEDYDATGHDYQFTAHTNIVTPAPTNETVDDAHALIYGDTWYVSMVGTFGDNLKPADVQKYATMLGGKVVKSMADVPAPAGD